MKLIIELPDNVYNELKKRNCDGWLTSKEIECMNKAIVNGTPLEKEGYITTIERHKENMPYYPFD